MKWSRSSVATEQSGARNQSRVLQYRLPEGIADVVSVLAIWVTARAASSCPQSRTNCTRSDCRAVQQSKRDVHARLVKLL
jgi:hypothetical protein